MAHVDYLLDTVNPPVRDKTVNWIKEQIDSIIGPKSFDTIAVRGLSGIGIGSIIAYIYKKDLCILRKTDDKSNHSNLRLECLDVKKYIIIDDLVDSGDTCKEIIEGVEEEHLNSECVKIILYSDRRLKNKADILIV